MTTDRRIRVLFVSHAAGLQGSERSLLALVEALLRDLRFAPTVLVPRSGGLTDALEAMGAPLLWAPYDNWISPRRRAGVIAMRSGRLLTSVARLWPTIRRLNPDVIYTNSLATGIGLLLAKVLRVPHIMHVREFVHEDLHQHFDYGTRGVLALVRSVSHKVVYNSEAVARKYRPLLGAPPPSCVIYNGFDLDPLPPQNAAEAFTVRVTKPYPDRLLLMVGNVVPHKGPHTALRALGRLRAAGLPFTLGLLGSVSQGYMRELLALAHREDVAGYVWFGGFVNDPRVVMERAAALLMCSRCEAFGRAAVEAMALGTPVIAANAGGLPEIVKSGQNGFLFRPDDADDLAARVRQLTEDRDTYVSICRTAAESVRERFGIDRYVRECAEVIVRAARPLTP